MLLIKRLRGYNDNALKTAGLNMMKRHSWHISPELATLALFSEELTDDVKSHLVATMTSERGQHLLTSLPDSIEALNVLRSLFQTLAIDDGFLAVPVHLWSDTPSYITAAALVKNLVCINDCAESRIALIQKFNETITKDEQQKQHLLQVVEYHRKLFKNCNRDSLKNM